MTRTVSAPPPDLAFAAVGVLAQLLQRRQISPLELTYLFLDRIAKCDPILNTYITVAGDEALRAARERERELSLGRWRVPLHGIPIAHKDLFATRGLRTTGHSRVLEDWLPARNSAVVAQLEHAGAVVLGKANTHEFGNGATAFFGTPRNPWNAQRVTGGSSAGSASAVAAGLCVAATGTDGGGSLRVPASHCGVVGFKPTHGRVSTRGVLPYTPTFTAAGPMGRTVRDCAVLLAGMGLDLAPLEPCRRGLQVGIPREFMAADMQPVARQCIEAGLQAFPEMGARLQYVELGIDLDAVDAAHTVIERTEAVRLHHLWLQRQPERYAAMTRRRLLLGCCFDAEDRARAARIHRYLRASLSTVFEHIDVLAGPTVRRTAWLIGEQEPRATLFTKPANMGRLPAISLPSGLAEDGLPVGLQILGRVGSDAHVLAVAEALEDVLQLKLRPPPCESSVPFPKCLSEESPPDEADPIDEHLVVNTLMNWRIAPLEGDVNAVAADLQRVRDALVRWTP